MAEEIGFPPFGGSFVSGGVAGGEGRKERIAYLPLGVGVRKGGPVGAGGERELV